MKRFMLYLWFLSLVACQSTAPTDQAGTYQAIEGATMGTTYHINYADAQNRDFKAAVDQLLVDVNMDLSTYIDSSFISQFNQSTQGLNLQSKYVSSTSPHRHFMMNYYRAKEIYKATHGHFDPTVMPLVYYWGFGKRRKKVEEVDPKVVDSLRQLVGFDQVKLNEQTRFLSKTKPGIALDFSALAKGYGVDAICELLDQEGVAHYLVEIGGELRAKGKNSRGGAWQVGINTPKPDAALSEYEAIVKVQNMALASSGNYRNFYEVNGVKYSHTINPATGYSERNRLLSASVFAEDCMTADAYATACMVMGLEKSLKMVQNTPNMEAYFIYGDEDGNLAVEYTAKLKEWLVEL